MTKNKSPAVAATSGGAKQNVRKNKPARSNPNRHNAQLRTQLAQLRARYDGGAVAPAIYAVVRQLETEIAWEETAS